MALHRLNDEVGISQRGRSHTSVTWQINITVGVLRLALYKALDKANIFLPETFFDKSVAQTHKQYAIQRANHLAGSVPYLSGQNCQSCTKYNKDLYFATKGQGYIYSFLPLTTSDS